MPINTSLLIAAPMLQDAILDDSTGLPLVAGVITLYQDNARTILKNWYYQSGSPGAYSYIPLDNPLTLNGAGVITDPNGNDTIPFFYPYSEDDNVTPQPYYITIQDQYGHSKITRQNFPFNPTNSSIVNTVNATLKNYIVNNVFWRNVNTIDLTNLTSATIAPSIHQGFVTNVNVAAVPVPLLSMADISFFKSTTGATDIITFKTFSDGSFLSSANPANLDVTPEYYLNLSCTGTGSETFKYVQFPLSLHLKTLDSVPATITFWARCNNGANVITPQIYQYGGNGGGNAVITPIRNGTSSSLTLPVDANWHKYEFSFSMPLAANVSTGAAGDDAVFFQISYPSGGGNTFNIDLAKVCFYVGNQAPTNDMELYDPQEAIFNSQRTGDVRTSINTFQPYGWVPMNDGIISNSGTFTLPTNIPSSRAAQDTWPLFNLLWQLAQPHDTGSNANPICQMYTTLGVATNYGASAYADFITNSKQLQIPLALGRSLIGAPPAITCSYNHSTTPSWNQTTYSGSPAAVAGLFTINGTIKNTLLYPGAPVYLTGTLPASGAFTANIIYYLIPDPSNVLGTGNTFQLATTYANALNVNAIAAVGTGDSSAVMLNFALAGVLGQGTHVQQLTEVVGHTHPVNIPVSGSNGGSQTVYQGSTTTGNVVISTQTNTPAGYGFNLIQPSTYVNVFMKL